MRIKSKSEYVTAALFISFLLFPYAGEPAGKPDKPAAGPAFTNPAKTFPMPAEWEKKPVTYEQWAEKADISISLEQDVYQTILPLIEKYAKDNNLKIVVREGTCGIAAGMLTKKTVDIGGFCCPAGAEDRLPGLTFHTLGITAKAFLVHPDNPVEGLSTGELTNILRGGIYSWSELKDGKGRSGPAQRIRVIGRLHCQTRPGHWRLLMDKDKDFSPRMSEVGSIPDMISGVASSKPALGWEVLSMVEKYRKLGTVKTLKIDGYSPTDAEALAAKKYPFYRVYNITTWEGKGVENTRAGKLVEYLLREVEKLDPVRFGFASPGRLKKGGWKFRGNELIGEPR